MEVGRSHRKSLPKNLISPLLVQDRKDEGFETCSPDHTCTHALGMERLWWRHNNEKRQNPNLIRFIFTLADKLLM